MKSRKIFFYLLLAGGVIALDQIIKVSVIKAIPDRVVYNTVGAWGIIPVWMAVGSLISFLVITVLFRLASGLIWIIIAGGLSNLLDRLFYGGVVDYIQIGTFPTFNFADAAITCAVSVYVIREIYILINSHRITSDR